jgi:YD repeat-containing protein
LQRLTDAVENLDTIHYAYDAAGNRTTVMLNGVPDTHHDFDAANQVLG